MTAPAQNTPTPWHAEARRLYYNHRAGLTIAKVAVALMTRDLDMGDLLVASKEMLNTLEGYVTADDDDDGDPAPLMLAKWRAAIARAEGGQP